MRDLLVSAFGVYGQIERQFVTGTITVSTSPDTVFTSWLENGPSSGITPSFSAGQLTLPVDGAYWVSFHLSFSGTASRTVTFQLFGSDTANGMRCSTKLDASGSITTVGFSGPVSATAGATLAILISADQNSTNVTPAQGSFAANLIG